MIHTTIGIALKLKNAFGTPQHDLNWDTTISLISIRSKIKKYKKNLP